MTPSAACGALLLGAGFGRRFGGDKRLASFRGSTVAEQTSAVYRSVFAHLRIVIRAEDDGLRERLAVHSESLVSSQDAHLGMGHSLAAGMQDLTWEWVFVGLLDMPMVQPETLRQLRDAALAQTTPAIIRPHHTNPQNGQGVPGHPVGWHRYYFNELQRCQGDEGARRLLRRYAGEIIEIAVDDAGVHLDIDRPEDLTAYNSPQ